MDIFYVERFAIALALEVEIFGSKRQERGEEGGGWKRKERGWPSLVRGNVEVQTLPL